jgi:hypothetical protein
VTCKAAPRIVSITGRGAPTSQPHHTKELVVTTKTAVRKPAAKQLVQVTVRRFGKPVGDIPAGRFFLCINPKVFGSTGDNFLGGSKATFATRAEALAAAPRLGGRIAS